MEFFKQLNKGSGGYIFLSHSHEDIQKVRLIRNDLENAGFEPLCFYLKCMDEANDEELWSLIRREIDARDLFLLVDSENSRNSAWVQREQEYIRGTNKDKILTVDLEDPDAVYRTIQKIRRDYRVFLSYSYKDFSVARSIHKKLSDKDFLVFWTEDLRAGSQWMDSYWVESMIPALAQASREGCVIVLISEDAMRSPWVKQELMYAIKTGDRIFPVLLGDVKLDPRFEFFLYNKSMFHLSADPSDEELDQLVAFVGRLLRG